MRHKKIRVGPVMACALALAAWGCDSTAPLDLRPATVSIVSGDEQVGVVGQQLEDPLVARVLNAEGQPVPGALVNFVVVKGGGTVFAGGSLSNAEGIVQDLWTLGTSVADSQVVEARAVDPTTGAPLVFGRFVATPLPDDPLVIAVVSGSGQTVAAGSNLPDSLLAQVRDQYGNPVPGVEVTWSIVSGGGSLTTTSGTSSATGHVSTKWTVGEAAAGGSVSATASAVQAATFTATIVPGAPAQLIGWPTTPFTGAAGEEVDMSVKATDAFGNPIAGQEVWFCVPNVASDCSDVTRFGRSTDANGVTTLRANLPCVLNTPDNVRFMAPFDTTDVVAIATGAGYRHTIEDSSGQVFRDLPASEPGGTIPVTVRVLDRCGNPKPGWTVGFAVEAGSGTVTPATAVTNDEGLATVSWTMGTIEGSNILVTTESDARGLRVRYNTRAFFDSPHLNLSVSNLITSSCCKPTFGDSLTLRTSLTSTFALASVKARVRDREVDLPLSGFSDSVDTSKVSLIGLPFDTMTVTVTAVDVNGNKESRFYPIIHAAPSAKAIQSIGVDADRVRERSGRSRSVR